MLREKESARADLTCSSGRAHTTRGELLPERDGCFRVAATERELGARKRVARHGIPPLEHEEPVGRHVVGAAERLMFQRDHEAVAERLLAERGHVVEVQGGLVPRSKAEPDGRT